MANAIKNKKKILIFNPFGIGDVLCTTPLIRNIKEQLPDSSISFICNRRVYPLLRNNKFLNRVMVFEKDEWKEAARESRFGFFKKFFAFKKEVKMSKFDIVFDLSLKSFYGFFFKICGIRTRIGFNFKNRGRFLTHKADLNQGFRFKHVAKYYLDLLKFLNITPTDYKYDLPLSEQSIQVSERILRNNNISKDDLVIGICPASGDSWGKTAYFRRWPKEDFAKLCDKLIQELGAKIVLFRSKTETAICDEVYKQTSVKPLNFCGRLSLDNFCAMLSLCNFVITNDGGPFHMVQALGKRAIGFIGPVDEKVYGTYPDRGNYFVFTKNVGCRPCYKRFRFPKCEFDKRCLRQITVNEVFAKAKELISSA